MFSIQNHSLLNAGAAVPFTATPNQGGVVRPLYLIMHYTAGTSASGAISWLANPEAKASAHLVVDTNGAVTQMVRFNRVAWHAGRSNWGDLEGMNQFSIGIELVNAGKLRRVAGKWLNWAGRAFLMSTSSRIRTSTRRHRLAGRFIPPRKSTRLWQSRSLSIGHTDSWMCSDMRTFRAGERSIRARPFRCGASRPTLSGVTPKPSRPVRPLPRRG